MYTDHKALEYMLEQRKLSGMLERRLEEILEFDFSVEHIPGLTNVLPDCLSRLYKSAPPSSGAPTVFLAVPTMGLPVGGGPESTTTGPWKCLGWQTGFL